MNSPSPPLDRFVAARLALARQLLQRRVRPSEVGTLGAEAMLFDAEATVRECEQWLPQEIGEAYARLQLSQSEWAIVWLLAAEALDDESEKLFAALDLRGSGVALRTLRTLVYQSSLSRDGHAELGPSGTLRRLGIIERCDGGPSELHEVRQSWKLSARFLGFLHGDSSPDDCLRSALRSGTCAALPELAVGGGAVDDVRRAMRGSHETIVVSGNPFTGRRTLLLTTSHELGRTVIQVDVRGLSIETPMFCRQLRALALEARLAGAWPLFLNIDALVADKDTRLALITSEFAPLIDGLILATCGVNRPAMTWDRPVITIEMGPPTTAQRATLWHTALGQGTERRRRAPRDAVSARARADPPRRRGRARRAPPASALEPDDIYAGIRSRARRPARRAREARDRDADVGRPRAAAGPARRGHRADGAHPPAPAPCTSSGASRRRSARGSASRRCSRGRRAPARRWSRG